MTLLSRAKLLGSHQAKGVNLLEKKQSKYEDGIFGMTQISPRRWVVTHEPFHPREGCYGRGYPETLSHPISFAEAERWIKHLHDKATPELVYGLKQECGVNVEHEARLSRQEADDDYRAIMKYHREER